MAPFDYTEPNLVFGYGNSDGSAVTPVVEGSLMADLVTGMSRALDVYCNQTLYGASYTAEPYRALVDQEGVLTCYPAVPTMAQPTAAAWRVGRSSVWTTLNAAALDIEINTFGCVVRVVDSDYLPWRGQRVQMRLTYTGGWANLAAVPADFAFATRRLCWWAYQKRSAPIDQTAIPEMGILTIPSNWPKDLKDAYRQYVRQVPM